MTSLVAWIADFKNVMLSLAYPICAVLVFGLFISFIVMLAIRLKNRWMIFLPSLVFAVCMCATVIFNNVARSDFVRAEFYLGDGIVFSSNEGAYVCDMSDGEFHNMYYGASLVKENCITEIEGVVLTHYSSAHTRSLQRLSRIYKVRSVFLPMPQNSSEDMQMRSTVRVLSEQNVPVYIYEANEPIDLLSGSFTLSDRSYIKNYAHPSVVLTYKNGESRITLIGKPYFGSYLEESGTFERFINDSDYLIFGSDGMKNDESFEIYSTLKDGCEVSFADAETFLLSDFETFIDKIPIYFDVFYKNHFRE
jgi:beta-lactamase superfamily II metal-dependent hydrolase